MIKIAPSILSADFAALGEAAAHLAPWGADYLHFDVMDGCFVPTITFGPAMLKALRKYTELVIDVHLMVDRPEELAPQFIDAGADIITFHAEASRHIHRALYTIKNAGVKAGVVLNPATPVSAVENVIEDCDMVLLMSVNPGAGGQKFIPSVLRKLGELRELAARDNPELLIEVDGGINPENAALCIDAGANVLVAGSSVFKAKDPAEMIRLLRCGR